MASALALAKLFANAMIRMFDHDATDSSVASIATNGTDTYYQDMRNFEGFAVIVGNQALTGAGVTKVEIVACEDESATGLQVIKDSGTVAADALKDYVALECSAEEIADIGRAAGKALRYAAARITCANAADEAKVVYIAHTPKRAYGALTATYIS